MSDRRVGWCAGFAATHPTAGPEMLASRQVGKRGWTCRDSPEGGKSGLEPCSLRSSRGSSTRGHAPAGAAGWDLCGQRVGAVWAGPRECIWAPEPTAYPLGCAILGLDGLAVSTVGWQLELQKLGPGLRAIARPMGAVAGPGLVEPQCVISSGHLIAEPAVSTIPSQGPDRLKPSRVPNSGTGTGRAHAGPHRGAINLSTWCWSCT